MKTKIRGFFGLAAYGGPTPFASSCGKDGHYVIEFAKDGTFFTHRDGTRTRTERGDKTVRGWCRFIKDGDWMKFEDGNPFLKNEVVVRFHLQTWDKGGKPVIHDVKTKPHWAHRFIYTTEVLARAEKRRFMDEDKKSKWRIVRKTEEVLP